MLVYALFVLVPILGVAGLAVDSAHLTYFKTRMQNAADSAALAAVMELPVGVSELASTERDIIVAVARSYAAINMSAELYGDVVPVSAVDVGFLDSDGAAGTVGAFYPEASLPADAVLNAVRVRAMRTETNGNAVRNMFVAVIGGDTSDVVASAIAVNLERQTLPPCVDSGLMSLGGSAISSNSTMLNGTCMHSDGQLSVGQNTCVQIGEQGTGTALSVSNINDANLGANAEGVTAPEDCGTSNAVPVDLDDFLVNASFADYLVEPNDFIFDLSLPAGDPNHVATLNTFIDNFRGSEFDPGWPDCPGFPASGNNVSLAENFADPCVAIVDGDLQLKRINGPLAYDNIMLLVKGAITFGADTRIGAISTCDTVGQSSSLVIASEGGHSPAKLEFYGTQLIFGDTFSSAAIGTTVGMSMLSAGELSFTSNWDITGCQDVAPPINFEEVSENPPPVRKLVF